MLDIDSIMGKVDKFSKSPKGKKMVKEYLKDCVENGIGKTEGGGVIITTEMMKEAAQGMINILQTTAYSKDMPESVKSHFSSLAHNPPQKLGDDSYVIDIYFADDLSRLSLLITSGDRKGERTGGGIRNIVSLFDTGYSVENFTYGLWDGHEDIGVIRSKKEREGLYFMREAVDAFNRIFGEKYGVIAQISADPDYYAR